MNKIINKFMPELHLQQPGFTYSACEPLTKHRERIQKFRETGNLKHLQKCIEMNWKFRNLEIRKLEIYRNELDKACFSHNAAYSESNDLAK